MKAVLTHLSGPFRGETEIFEKERILFGTGPDGDVRIATHSSNEPRVEIRRENCEYYLRDMGSSFGTFVNAHQVGEIILQDGDLVELGPGGPKIRFRFEAAEGEVCKPFRIVCRDCLRKARRFHDSPRAVLWALMRDLPRAMVHETTPAARAVAAGVVGLALLSLGVSGSVLVHGISSRRSVEREIHLVHGQLAADLRSREALVAQVAAERRKGEELAARREAETGRRLAALQEDERALREKLQGAEAGAASRGVEIAAVREKLASATQQIASFEKSRTLAERIIREKAGGVALLEGAYRFTDSAGRPLRYAEVTVGAEKAKGAGSPIAYATTGDGPIVRQSYTGTGFLVSEGGFLLTNRHVAEPWWGDKKDAEIIRAGYRPHLEYLRAFFPTLDGPLELEVSRVSSKADVALAKADVRGRRLPILELRSGPGVPLPGQPVILLGYPTGLDALLARLDDPTVDAIVNAAGSDDEKIAGELARRRLIRPLATQGHLGDVLREQLVYDAASTLGASGGPVFNERGKVVAINAAVLPEFGGANFGVPIAFGSELLRR